MNHVIILGAGASKPLMPLASDLTDDLRKLRRLVGRIEPLLGRKPGDPTAPVSLGATIVPYINSFQKDMEEFDGGGYDTIDQFGESAFSGKAESVQKVKQLLRLVLAYYIIGRNYNGVTTWKATYENFAKRLFDANDLLRDEITILTFNYDPLLELILEKMIRVRCGRRGHYAGSELEIRCSAVRSGFGERGEISWTQGNRLRLLKLHGSITYPIKIDTGSEIQQGHVASYELLDAQPHIIFDKLCSPEIEDPPLVFPYEIVKSNGELRPAEEFAVKPYRPWPTAHYSIYHHFAEVWCLAQEAIRNAEKVSFVGLSMHKLLHPAMKFLFGKRQGDTIGSVVVNPAAESIDGDFPGQTNVTYLTFNALRNQANVNLAKPGLKNPFPKVYKTFADFIANEV